MGKVVLALSAVEDKELRRTAVGVLTRDGQRSTCCVVVESEGREGCGARVHAFVVFWRRK